MADKKAAGRPRGLDLVDLGYDSTHYYGLSAPGGWLLIDAGWPGTLPKLRAAHTRMGIQERDLRYLLCTHFHPDHAGIAQDLKNLGVRLIVPPEQEHGAIAQRTIMRPRDPYIDIDMATNLTLPLAESAAFLASVGIPGCLIHTPGHSDDSVSLVLEDGRAFIGDLYGRAWSPEPDQAKVDRSWRALQAAGARRIFPGHGPIDRPIEDYLG